MSLFYDPFFGTTAAYTEIVDDDAIEEFWGSGWGLTSPVGLPATVVAPSSILPSFGYDYGDYGYGSLYYPNMGYGYGWRGYYQNDDFDDYYGDWCGHDDDCFDEEIHIMRRRSL
jgi:hypothetical protein